MATLLAVFLPASGYAQDIRMSAADTLALAVTIFRVAFSNGTQTAHAAAQPELVCVGRASEMGDPPTAVIDSLQSGRTLLVRPISACRREPLRGSTRGVSLVVDTLTGKRGISVSATDPVFRPNGTFTVDTAYYQHGLSGAGWTCQGRRSSDGHWEITSCKMNWIS